jgi:hypothetical protein
MSRSLGKFMFEKIFDIKSFTSEHEERFFHQNLSIFDFHGSVLQQTCIYMADVKTHRAVFRQTCIYMADVKTHRAVFRQNPKIILT